MREQEGLSGAQAYLELMWLRLKWDSLRHSCLSFLSAGMTGCSTMPTLVP